MLKLEINPHSQVMRICPDGPLSAVNSREISDRADQQLRRAGGLQGLRLEAAQFPGWRDWSELFRQIRCLRDKPERIRRIAVLTDSPPVEFKSSLQAHFAGAQLRIFGMDEGRRADAWLTAEADAAPREAPAAAAAPIEESAEDVGGVGEIELDDSGLDEPDETDSWFTS